MIATFTFTIDKKTGTVFAHFPLASEGASTFHSDHITLDRAAAVAEADSIIQDAFEELAWRNIVSTPHVLHGLRRLAAEARRQIAEGEYEEGGFAIE